MNMYYIAVFGSRNASLRFNDILQKHNITSSIISTPREASLGCGVCVKFRPEDYNIVKQLYDAERSFKQVKFYKVRNNGKGFLVSSI